MSRLRAVSLFLAAVAATGLVFGTVGFTAMSADRGVGVSLAADETAFVGYDTLTDTVDDGEPTAVVEYENRFDRDLETFDVNVSIVDPDDTDAEVVAVETPGGLEAGATESVSLACPAEEEIHLRFQATGADSGVSISLDRVHAVTCMPDDEGDERLPDDEGDERLPDDEGDEPTVTGVTFTSAANAGVAANPVDDDLPAIV